MIVHPLPESPREKSAMPALSGSSSKQHVRQLLAEVEVVHVDKGSPQSSGRPSP